jgi:hypothetical protein
MAKEHFILTDNQKSLILEKFQSGVQDMDMLTKLAWEDQTIDGRHAKGRAVKKFLVENELKYKTLHHERVDRVELTPEMGETILAEARKGKGHLEIAQIIFPDRQVKKLSREWRAVLNFITAHAPDMPRQTNDDPAVTKYTSPKEPARVIKKINDATGLNLDTDVEKLSNKYRILVDKLTISLADLRFRRICDSYASMRDRDLFEQQYISQTWDKPDLTKEEVNMYMSVCKDIVTAEQLSGHINTLNSFFESMEDASELTVRFSDTLKAKTDEYNQCQKRISDNIKKLQGDRSERLKGQKRDEVSFISVVQMAQEEQERKNMLRLAELQRRAIEDEANRLENMDELMCRIFGVSKEEVV